MDDKRLIDANELKRRLIEGDGHDDDRFTEGYNFAINEIRGYIADALTVEVQPVMHGRWETWGYIFHGIAWKRCSVCGKTADVSYQALLDGKIEMATPSICGCCGARMDGDSDDEP